MKTIIFDFDGTLADTFALYIKVYHQMSAKFGCPQLSEVDIERMCGLHPRAILKECKITWWKLPFMIWEAKKRITKHIQDIQTFPGVLDDVRKLCDQGIQVGILTSNHADTVQAFLKNHGVLDCFAFVHGEKNIFGKHLALNKIIDLYELDRKNLIYIGDEVRDIEACRKIDIRCLSVPWGFNSREALVDAAGELVERIN